MVGVNKSFPIIWETRLIRTLKSPVFYGEIFRNLKQNKQTSSCDGNANLDPRHVCKMTFLPASHIVALLFFFATFLPDFFDGKMAEVFYVYSSFIVDILQHYHQLGL